MLAGTGAATTEDAVSLTKAAVQAGADAVLAFPPPAPDADAGGGAGPYSASLAAYYGAVGAAGGGQPCSRTTCRGSPRQAFPSLTCLACPSQESRTPRVAPTVCSMNSRTTGATYVGSSALLALAGPMGGAGAILALANVEPERCCRAFAGEAAVQRDLPTYTCRCALADPQS